MIRFQPSLMAAQPIDNAAVQTQLDNLLAISHAKLNHLPLTQQQGAASGDIAASVEYSIPDEIAALRDTTSARFFNSRDVSSAGLRNCVLEAVNQQLTFFNRLLTSQQSFDQPTTHSHRDPQPQGSQLNDSYQQHRFLDTISIQSKAISAVKSQVEGLVKTNDFSKAISSKKPENVLLFLASLEQALSSAGIGQEYWSLSLPFLSSQHSITDVLTNFVAAPFGSLLDFKKPAWSTVKDKIIREWATHWNPKLFYRELHQLKQQNMQFTFFLMEIKTRFNLLQKDFLAEEPEFLLCLLREEILHELYLINRTRNFSNMEALVHEIHAALASNRACDGKSSSFDGLATVGSIGCDSCKKRGSRFWKSHSTEACNYHSRNNNRAVVAEESLVEPSSSSSSASSVVPVNNSKTNISSQPLDAVTCFKCGQKGHVATTCKFERTEAGQAAQAAAEAAKGLPPRQKN